MPAHRRTISQVGGAIFAFIQKLYQKVIFVINYLQLEHEIEKITHSFHRLRSERRVTRTLCRGRAQWPITFLNTNL